MIKVVAVLNAKPGISREEFLHKWNVEHPVLVRRLPGLRRYRQNPAIEHRKEWPFNGMAELWFDSVADVKAAYAGEEARRVFEHEDEFLDRMQWFLATSSRSTSARNASGPDMTVPRAESESLESIRCAAIRLFFEQGYDATTLRQIAAAAGLKVGSLYYHIAGKESLLLDIMCRALDDLMADVRSAVGGEPDPVARLRVAVATQIRFHAVRAAEVFVGNTELRSLSAEGRRIVVARREEYEQLMLGLIEAVAAGRVEAIDTRTHLYRLLAHAAHVAGWFRAEGPMDVSLVGTMYAELALRGLGLATADH